MTKEIIFSSSSPSSEADIIEAINKSKRDSVSPTPSEPETNPASESKVELPQIPEGFVVLSKKEQDAIINLQVAKQVSHLQKQMADLQGNLEGKLQEANADKSNLQKEIQDLEQKLQIETKRRETLIDAFNEVTPENPFPGPGTTFITPQSTRGDISPRDALREFKSIWEDKDQSPSRLVVYKGERFLHQDSRAIVKFIKKNRVPLRDAIANELRKRGFLCGQSSYQGSDAPTSLANLEPFFKTYLSAVTRITHSVSFVLWQFPNREVANGIPPGQTIGIARVLHLTSGETEDDWLLTPGQDLVADNQPLQATEEQITIRLNGMGRITLNAPVNIPEFLLASSLERLENALQSEIGYNYHKFEDISIFNMWKKTTVKVYNNRDNVVFDAEQVVSGGGGQASQRFLTSFFSYMSGSQILTYKDGCYGLCVSPIFLGQLENDLSTRFRYLEPKNIEELTNLLKQSTNNEEMDKISGYVGKICGFHIFCGNSFGSGPIGSRGVQEELFGDAKIHVTCSAFAFGSNSVGWATAMPMEIREESLRFQLGTEYIWKSHEGWGALDVDPLSDPPNSSGQQLRVVEVRVSQDLV